MANLLLFIILAVGIVWLISHYNKVKRAERLAYLTKKYKDQHLVDKLMNRQFWQGQTSEQLLDSLGKPADIDNKVLKTKKKEIWKYDQDGRNRYCLRVILENDTVVGWDQR